ncbi:MAG: CDP-alcohol phosphatidyltransferase family protein [Anaerolineales bacterium]|nr:CDP-alcohol phosphatidyltransferase family protein [Anaerolineales bacterium]
MGNHVQDRRPISARSNPLFQQMAVSLARYGVSPNLISITSILFAACAGVCLFLTRDSISNRILWSLSAVFILLRLLANMLDGMVAVESNKTSSIGDIFNEVPDRVSDAIIFVGAGFAAGSSIHSGYIAAVLSILVAYIRALGNQMGVTQLFGGPMAKSHRMFLLAGVCFYLAIAPNSLRIPGILSWGLLVIILGSALTVILRLQRIVTSVRS